MVKLIRKHALVFGISIGISVLFIATLLLIYAPDQTSYVLTMAGLLCSCVSMLLMGADVRRDRQSSHR